MANHPHDCPVCDEGGECHLQNMTVMTGHWKRRYRFPKRTFENQDLGLHLSRDEPLHPVLPAACASTPTTPAGTTSSLWAPTTRCTLGVTGTASPRVSSAETIEVCPTGVFTDKTFRRHFTRKWNLETAPSVCVHCGRGCNTTPGERYGVLRRSTAATTARSTGTHQRPAGPVRIPVVGAGTRARLAAARRTPLAGITRSVGTSK